MRARGHNGALHHPIVFPFDVVDRRQQWASGKLTADSPQPRVNEKIWSRAPTTTLRRTIHSYHEKRQLPRWSYERSDCGLVLNRPRASTPPSTIIHPPRETATSTESSARGPTAAQTSEDGDAPLELYRRLYQSASETTKIFGQSIGKSLGT